MPALPPERNIRPFQSRMRPASSVRGPVIGRGPRPGHFAGPPRPSAVASSGTGHARQPRAQKSQTVARPTLAHRNEARYFKKVVTIIAQLPYSWTSTSLFTPVVSPGLRSCFAACLLWARRHPRPSAASDPAGPTKCPRRRPRPIARHRTPPGARTPP